MIIDGYDDRKARLEFIKATKLKCPHCGKDATLPPYDFSGFSCLNNNFFTTDEWEKQDAENLKT